MATRSLPLESRKELSGGLEKDVINTRRWFWSVAFAVVAMFAAIDGIVQNIDGTLANWLGDVLSR